MDQMIELLQQIQDLAGVGIDALKEAAGGGGRPEGEGGEAPGGPPAPGGGPAAEEAPPADQG